MSVSLLEITSTPLPRFIAGIFPDGEEEAQCIRIAHPSAGQSHYIVPLGFAEPKRMRLR
jgi:hypothetical protein